MFSFKVLLLILACLWISDAATDTLSLGDKLNSSDHLVSKSGNVTLGFYKQEYDATWGDKGFGYYLALRYTEDTLNHPIWLANRDDPIADDSGVLIIDNTGLKITHAVVRLKDRVLWTTGESFENILPLDPLNMNYNFTNVSNVDEQYLYYTLLIGEYTPEDGRKNARLVLLDDGSLECESRLYLFNSGTCAGDITENGCVRWEGPKCRSNGDKVKKLDMDFNIYSDRSNDHNTARHPVLFEKKKKNKNGRASDISELHTGNHGHNLNIYTAAFIMSATNCFSPENLLGKGGFGPVFKGTFPDGQEVAIKRLSRGSGQGLVEFKNELILIAKLQHTNLAWELWKHGAALELVDPTLSDSCSKPQVLRCITLGLLCVEDSPLDRPTMSDVISMLTGEMQLPLPKNPAFSTGRRIIETNVEEKEFENYSLNGLSMSVMDPR
ncbi:hypothetical protein SCA6_000028 [Theobroma cacao]